MKYAMIINNEESKLSKCRTPQEFKNEIKRRKEERNTEKSFKIIVLLTIIIMILFGWSLYQKTHEIRYCEVITISEKDICVEHPNGNLYRYIIEETETYKTGEFVEVCFDELSDWNKYYFIRYVKKLK